VTAELVDSRTIAERLGLSHPESVHTWRYRDPSFPEPVAQIGQAFAWRWSDVERWARRTGRLTEKGRATRPSKRRQK
jgi:predicted DNA-binding transcriptional regulator AlpA